MKRIGLFLIVAIALMLSGSAMAQNVGDSTYYFVTYYANNVSGAPDGTLRIINDGSGYYPEDQPGIPLWAAIYVFDDSQELQACGACEITPDGILSEDVKTELTNNTVTGRTPTRGVIKILSNIYASATDVYVSPGLHGWATHIERATPTSGAYATTEAPLADSNITETEGTALVELCYYAQQLGSGQGTITCTPEDNDF